MAWKHLLASGAYLFACMFAFIAGCNAAELKVMSPVAMKPVLAKIGADIERTTGNTLAITWGESGSIRSDIEKGVPFDVAILTLAFVDDLIKAGKLDAGSKTPVARSGIGIAIRKGARKPDVGTTEAFKRTLMEAKSIGFVEHSASSRYLNTLLGKLGIADAVKSKLKPLGGPAASFVANGDPEIAITQIAAIRPSEGVELAGPLPPDLQLYTVFVAAAPAASNANADAARGFLKALASPSTAALFKEAGLEPPM
jgi:molybdate transport system substrate-binding protein